MKGCQSIINARNYYLNQLHNFLDQMQESVNKSDWEQYNKINRDFNNIIAEIEDVSKPYKDSSYNIKVYKDFDGSKYVAMLVEKDGSESELVRSEKGSDDLLNKIDAKKLSHFPVIFNCASSREN